MSADRPRERLLTLASPVSGIRGVGPVRAASLAAAGLETVADLLAHLPARYEDRRVVTPVAGLTPGVAATVIGRLEEAQAIRLGRRRILVRARLVAAEPEAPASVRVAWFNQPYLANRLVAEASYLLYGKVRERAGELELVNPSVERLEGAEPPPRIVPVYPPVGELGPALVRRLAAAALADLDPDAAGGADIPEAVLEARRLPRLHESLEALHAPTASSDLEALAGGRTPAHERLVYEELLALQIALARARRRRRRRTKPHGYGELPPAAELSSTLPFRLTAAQERSLLEILTDLGRPAPMHRLLQGDVGSGKTVVAALALAATVRSGLQGALMAPTTLLARQHLESLRGLLGSEASIELFTRETASAESIERLRSGAVGVAVGTHALVEERAAFRHLGLVVIDEQHRFGVRQRRRLVEKGPDPDLLVMTATPIPRSLALTVYGDLALSVIDELPPGRRPVATRVVSEAEREGVYSELEVSLRAGDKAYVVLPLIEASDRVAAHAIEALGTRLANRLAGFDPLVLHGRMKTEEREAAMTRFAKGSAGVLIATSLVEVGLDVPEATTMVIESAERFGLAQLHQLRGRVGRGRRASRCVAIHGQASERACSRLETFAATTDGFDLAEADLALRGPGEVLGDRQTGQIVASRFRAADLVRHRAWIERARQDAERLLAERPAGTQEYLSRLEATGRLRREDALVAG